MRAYNADVFLICGNTTTKCERCHKECEAKIQLPHPGEKPTIKALCKPCLADIVEDFFHAR